MANSSAAPNTVHEILKITPIVSAEEAYIFFNCPGAFKAGSNPVAFRSYLFEIAFSLKTAGVVYEIAYIPGVVNLFVIVEEPALVVLLYKVIVLREVELVRVRSGLLSGKAKE